jgi:hypothetical protein
MPSSSHFFQKLGVLQPVSKLFMALGVIGIIATFLTGLQTILTWSAVSIGLGLALVFFREAFRPRTGPHKSRSSGSAEPQPNYRRGITRHLGKIVLLAVSAVTVVSGVLAQRSTGRSLSPGRLLLVGFLSLIVINIVLFCANLLKAMGAMRGAKNEAELEHVMVPALQGEPSHLSAEVLEIFRLLAAASAGFTLGAAVLYLIRRFVAGY